jgi:hypothetical protein
MVQASKLSPKSARNIAGYGLGALDWDRVLERLEQEWKLQPPPEMGGTAEPHTHWLATTRADGRPHLVPVGMVWHEGSFYFSSGARTEKSKDLARDPRCAVSLAAAGIDITLEGEATRVTDDATLRRVAAVFASAGWAPEVRDSAFFHEFSAASAGPPPWHLYEFKPATVYGFAMTEPHGATRWRF